MALIDEAKMGERDIAAWVRILELEREAEEAARSRRLRIAHELGFDARHPRDVKVGDTIRTKPNCWHKVVEATRIRRVHEDGAYWLFRFNPAEAAPMTVEDISEDHPVGPVSVLVASPEPSSVF